MAAAPPALRGPGPNRGSAEFVSDHFHGHRHLRVSCSFRDLPGGGHFLPTSQAETGVAAEHKNPQVSGGGDLGRPA